jgi:hypothetical protein
MTRPYKPRDDRRYSEKRKIRYNWERQIEKSVEEGKMSREKAEDTKEEIRRNWGNRDYPSE